MVLPSIILMVGLVYLEYELSETRKENQELIQQLLQFRQQSGGSEEGRKAYLKGAVKNTIVKHAGSIQNCFLKLIESNPDIPESGRVLVDWQIDPRGKVFGAGVVRDAFGNKVFQTCIERAISDIRFPAPPFGNPTYVEHTFFFKKEENK